MKGVLQTRSVRCSKAFKPFSAVPLRYRKCPGNSVTQKPLPRVGASLEDVDLETQVEIFMKRQAELESGAAFARTSSPDQIIGGDVVSEEDAKRYCRDIVKNIQLLKETRDMAFNEIKLVVSIEDPRVKERRSLGIEDESGVSRDELAAALVEVHEGRIPKDRIALKVLWEEMAEWPFLTMDKPATGAAPGAPSLNKDYSAIGGGQQAERL